MSSVACWLATLSAWISEHIDEAKVISGSNQTLLLIHINAIDVWAVGFSWEHAINAPTELAMLRVPNGTCCIWGTWWILVSWWKHEEKELISVTDGSKIAAILTPVHASNCSIVLVAFRKKAIAIGNIIDVNICVVRAYSKIISIWTVLSSFDPLKWVHQLVHWWILESINLSDCHRSIVGANSNMSIWIVDCNGSWALTIREASKSTCSVSSCLSLLLVNISSSKTFSLIWTPLLDLIVVARCVDISRVHVETPDFTIIMTLHQCVHFARFDVTLNNWSISQSNHKFFMVEAIDCSWQNSKIESFFLFKSSSIGNDHSAISTTRE